MKKRSSLKLLSKLYLFGVIDSGVFINIIKDLTSMEHLKDRDAAQTNSFLLLVLLGKLDIILDLLCLDKKFLKRYVCCHFLLFLFSTSQTVSSSTSVLA